MLILDGKACAAAGRQILKVEIGNAVQNGHKKPGLAVILVGDDPASQVYVKNKIAACKEVGIESALHALPKESSEGDVLSVIHQLNHSSLVSGILLQLPVPMHLNAHTLISAISPMKDADCLTAENVGLFFTGRARTQPCTPAGVMTLLSHNKIDVAGKSAVVVGRSHIVGLPMFHLLQSANATVTICHSKTKDVSHFTKQADIVVAAAGRPHLLGKSDFKKGSVVVDVGIHRTDDGLVGDVRFDELKGHCTAATPVPGGVGPMTILTLLQNTWTLAKASQ